MLTAGRPSQKQKTPKQKAIEAVQEPDKPKLKRFNVDISEELHRRVKARATEEGITLNELAVRLFEGYLGK